MKKKVPELSAERLERRHLAEADLYEFIQLVLPKRLLGNIHREVISWWTSSTALSHQLLLLPRGHMKSVLIACRVAWELTRNPTLTILYISSTSNLATKQLKFIKDILTSDRYRLYWPEMVDPDEAKREKWTEKEISVDHPLRKEESIRDPSIFTAGLTTNIVGLHCDIEVLDDVVVATNAYLEVGREKVREQYGYLSSIGNAGSKVWVVGTRYHPLDLYHTLQEMQIETYDSETGSIINRTPLYDVKEWPVENVGDGTGEFIWPRQQRSDGQWFGFNAEILAAKRSEYTNRIHFRAQYYNDPQDVDSSPIKRELFQYYDNSFLNQKDGKWFFKDERLTVVAAVDFAYSLGVRSDSSSIVVLGVDGQSNYYVLAIERFKTERISDYYKKILKLYEYWGFRRIRAEVSVAQKVIVQDLKENYIRKNGLSLVVEEYRPSRWAGSKEERIMATLEPRYANGQIWHALTGNSQLLEEELIYANPAHDDIKDALASAIDFAQGMAPTNFYTHSKKTNDSVNQYHARFGGTL